MLRVICRLLEMIRFSHSQFALPFALLSAALAWSREPFRIVDLVGIISCMVFARSAAMAFNRLVDRRFYRGRYDAEVAVSSFAARLRDTVELGKYKLKFVVDAKVANDYQKIGVRPDETTRSPPSPQMTPTSLNPTVQGPSTGGGPTTTNGQRYGARRRSIAMRWRGRSRRPRSLFIAWSIIP